jgi:hypothetical protein
MFVNYLPAAAQSKGTCVALIPDQAGLIFKNLCNRRLSITWSEGGRENVRDIGPLSSTSVVRVKASVLTVKVQDY